MIDVQELLRRRVGSDLEERVARSHRVADLDKAALDDARDLRLDLETLARLDLADRQRLFGDRADLGLDQGVPVLVAPGDPTHA